MGGKQGAEEGVKSYVGFVMLVDTRSVGVSGYQQGVDTAVTTEQGSSSLLGRSTGAMRAQPGI